MKTCIFLFIRPILEYGDVVWQGASHSGAPYRSNIQSLYIELGWQNLHERHQQHTLPVIMMCKILNNHTPDYLRSLIPPLVGNTMKYQLQNQSNMYIQGPTFRIRCIKIHSFLLE